MSTLHAVASIVPQMVVTHNHLLMAHTYLLAGVLHLEVYRSVLLPESSSELDLVRAIIASHLAVEVSRGVEEDPMMFFREAERVIYRLEPRQAA